MILAVGSIVYLCTYINGEGLNFKSDTFASVCILLAFACLITSLVVIFYNLATNYCIETVR